MGITRVVGIKHDAEAQQALERSAEESLPTRLTLKSGQVVTGFPWPMTATDEGLQYSISPEVFRWVRGAGCFNAG